MRANFKGFFWTGGGGGGGEGDAFTKTAVISLNSKNLPQKWYQDV